MQEYTVLPELGVSPDEFWERCREEARRTNADDMLTYMRLLAETVERKQAHIGKPMLRKLAQGIEYFPGVDTWFERIDSYVRERSPSSVKVKHYVISAGLKEILEGVSIRKHFERVYACEYYFDHHDIAQFPTVVVNDTSKTQYLFRINKGRENIGESINDYMPEHERPIPFTNMLYIGDGLTDVPSMTVTKKNGGFAIAVHAPGNRQLIQTCRDLAKANRIDYFAPADYTAGTVLEKRVQLILDVIISRIMLEKEKFSFSLELERNKS